MLGQLFLNGILAGSITALLGLGFSVQYMASRFFVFTFGASFTAAAYTAFALRKSNHLVSLVAGVAVAILLGVLLEIFIYWPLRRRGRNPLILMLASIGLYVVLQNLISIFFGDVTVSIRSWQTSEGFSLLGGRIAFIQAGIIGSAIAVIVVTAIAINFSFLGLRLRAMLDDSNLALVIGINTAQVTLFGTALASALAGIAGLLTALDTDLVPTMGFNGLLLGIIAAIIGGIGSIKGAVLAGAFLGLVQHLAVWRAQTQWQEFTVFFLLLVFLLTRPGGIFGISPHSDS